MQTTDLTAMRSSLVTAVEAITPTFLAAETWDYVKGEVAGPVMRRFRLIFEDLEHEAEPGEGLWGNGQSYRVELRVEVSYADRPEEDVDYLVQTDEKDLYKALDAETNEVGGTAGLFSASHGTWELHGDANEDGAAWGAHVFTLRFFTADI